MDPKSQGMTFSFACSYAFEVLVYPSSDFSDGHVVRSKNSGQLGVRHGAAVGMQNAEDKDGFEWQAKHESIVSISKLLAMYLSIGLGLRMPLEDHIGDICRKARLQTKTGLNDAAQAAGVKTEELQQWESNGVIGCPVDIHALSVLLGLDSSKAVAVSQGWEPQQLDLSQWQNLSMLTTSEGFDVNSFVAWDPDSKEAAIFDTGWFAESIFALADSEGLNMRHLFITHMHGDHVAALAQIRKRWPTIMVYSNNDAAPEKNRIREGESVKLGCMEVRARFTPGHAVDGVTYVVDLWRGSAPPVAMVGDAIFAGSMGKDFSTPELAQVKVQEQILSLPGDALICPGHGPVTTVSQELEHNPFF